MKQKLYLECYAGISGDMTVAALLDLGASQEKLQAGLESLKLPGYITKVSRVSKAGLDACDFAVILDPDHDNHDHDMEFLHGDHDHHHHDHDHHHHDHDHHHHDHDHHHHDQNHHHAHEHRGLPEIQEILMGSQMTEHAKELAVRIFTILAKAESKAHGVPMDQVHFHEVGAVDSIVDIAAVAICMDDLGIEEVIVPILYEGSGMIRCQHGIIPVPVPATLNVVSEYKIRMRRTDTKGEFVTPTGAAIVAALRTGDTLPENYTVVKVGIGAGKRNYERPSILRAMLIEETELVVPTDEICKIECNIDDCSGEALGYAMDRLFAAGARDVHYVPCFMKKNRPGYILNVICSPEDRPIMEDILFQETTTIGVRYQIMSRTVLQRHGETIQTSFGEVQVKVLCYNGQEKRTPEYESVAAIAREKQLPYIDVFKQIEKEV